MTISAAAPGLAVRRFAIAHAPSLAVAKAAPATAAITVSLAYWGVPLTHDTGGRHSWTLGLAGLLLALAAALVRPWQVLSWRQFTLALSPFVASLVVGLTSPTGFSDLALVASYAYAGGLYLTVRAWVDTTARRLLVVLSILLVGLEQMSQAWLPWWGSQDVTTKMVGTFYWHNQFAAFVGAIAVVAAVAAVRAEGLARSVGWVVAPLCACGVVLSASRASLALLVLSWSVLLLRSLVDRVGRRGVLLLPVVVIGLATLLTSRLLMGASGAALSTLQARNDAESASANGGARLGLWRAAYAIWRQHPWTGGGLGSFRGESPTYTAQGVPLSSFAHSGPIQAFSDGGVVLGLAMAGCCGVLVLVAVRTVLTHTAAPSWPQLGAALAVISLSLHSAVDFDWQYASLLALYALLATVLPWARTVQQPGPPPAPYRLLAGSLATALIGTVLVGAGLATRARALEMGVPGSSHGWVRAVGVVVPLRGPVTALPASDVCDKQLSATDGGVLPAALRCTADAGAEDGLLQLRRAAAMLALGEQADAIGLALSVDAAQGDRRPGLRIAAASLFAKAGRRDLAVDRATRGYDRLVASHAAVASLAAARQLLQEVGIPVDAITDEVVSGGHA